MRAHAKILLALGALSAAASVVLGAAAAHAGGERLLAALPLFQTALQYHQFHALGLMLVGLAAASRPSAWLFGAGWLMLAGTLMFCGHLYLHSLAAYNGLHALAPVGGSAFIAAWLLAAVGFVRGRADSA